MAKRFFDTELWEKEWYQTLEPKMKCMFNYMLSRCNVAGIWSVNIGLAAYIIGETLTADAVQSQLEEHIHVLSPKKWWLIDFVPFQYGHLSENSPPHKAVIAILTKHCLWDNNSKTVCYPNARVIEKPCRGTASTPQDKDKVKVKEEDSPAEKEVLAYLNEKTGKHFAKITPELSARVKEYSVADCKKVIDNMTQAWLGSEMAQYLRPVTLFSQSKFEGYLNAGISASKPPQQAYPGRS